MVASSPEPVVLVYIRGVSQWWTIGVTVVTAGHDGRAGGRECNSALGSDDGMSIWMVRADGRQLRQVLGDVAFTPVWLPPA